MSMKEAMERVRAAGYGGFSMWAMGNQYMACLLTRQCEPDYSTNLWNWQTDADEALRLIVDKAERNPVNGE